MPRYVDFMGITGIDPGGGPGDVNNGIADNTGAFNEAFAAGKPVILAQSIYAASSVNVPDGATVWCPHRPTIAMLPNLSGGVCLLNLVNVYDFQLRGTLRLSGSAAADFKLIEDRGLRCGLNISAGGAAIDIDRLVLDGFDGYGAAIDHTDSSMRSTGPVIHSLIATNCWNAFIAGNGAEGLRILSGSIRGCREGLANAGGNNDYHLNVCDNYTGLHLYHGEPENNDNHGRFTGDLNHNTIPLFADGVERGFSLVGVHIFDGTVKLHGSSGVGIRSGIFGSISWDVQDGGVNIVEDNLIFDKNGASSYPSSSPTIFHNNKVFRSPA